MAGLGASLPLLGELGGGGPHSVDGVLADTVRLVQQQQVVAAKGGALSDTINLTATTAMLLVAKLAEAMRVGQLDAATFVQTLHDTAQVSLTTNLGRPVSLTDTTNLSLLLAAASGTLLAERLGIGATPLANSVYQLSLAQLVRLSDLSGFFLSADLADTVDLTSVLAGLYRPLAVLSELVELTASIAPVVLGSAVAADGVELTDALLAKAFYDARLADTIDLTIAMVDPAGDVTTWAINTRTGAATEYRNYDFNSFAQLGFHYLGANDDGLYQLDGDDDAGTDIIARIKSGFAQFGGGHFSGIKAAYLGVRGGGAFTLRLTTGDGKSYDYAITNANDMATTKVHVGKGLRARYFAFELISAGQDFDLDSIEFIPVVMQRRV